MIIFLALILNSLLFYSWLNLNIKVLKIKFLIVPLLKGPKLEIFVAEFFLQSKPVWVDDLGTRK